MRNTEVNFYGTDDQIAEKIEVCISKCTVIQDDEKQILREFVNELTSVSMPKRKGLCQHIVTLANRFDLVEWSKLDDLDYRLVQGELKQCGLSESYKQDLSTSGKRFALWLVSKGISKMTVEGIEAVKTHHSKVIPRDESSVIPDEDIAKIIDAESNLKYKVYFSLLCESGARPSEIAALKVSDIKYYEDEGCYVLNITGYKGGMNLRKVPVFKCVELLKVYLQTVHSGYLFPSNKGGALSYQTIANRFNALCEAVGIKDKGYSLYCLRHSKITATYKAGKNIEIAQNVFWGGESTMSKRYVHLTTSDIIDGMR